MQGTDEPIRVLHVDDDPAFAEMTATFLCREDDRFDVETARDAGEALERLATDRFDCVVSDYDMPGRHGIEFLEAVREEYPDLPFVLYTGKGSEAIASEAISAGVTDYLQKEGGTSQYAVLANRVRNCVENYRARAALEDREERLTLFFEQSPLGVIEWDENFDLVRMNDAAEDILGYSEADLVGRSWEVIVPDADRDAVGDVVADLLDDRGGYRSVNENVREDGERIVCEWHNRVVTDRDDEVVAVFSQFQDVTDRETKEAAVTRQRARFRALFEMVPEPVTYVRFEDGEPILVDVNPAFEETFGYEAERVVGRSGNEVLVPPDRESEAELVDERARAEGTVRTEVRRETTDGPRDFLFRSIPVGESGETDEYFGMYVDISDQKATERRLERQNERLDAFARVVSHDLRNPLDTADGWVELAREECDTDHLDEIDRLHDRMRALIDDLLTLAREGDTVGHLEPVDLGTAARDCWENVDTAGATLDVRTGATVRADRSRLRQLLANLVRNAVEHAGDDVTITVGDLDGGFYVEDDGPGIPEDQHDRAFEPGYSSRAGGTGFGLAIVREIARAHGWTVEVTHGSEGGARFEFAGVDSPQ